MSRDLPRLTRQEMIERVRRIIEMDGTDDELEFLAREVNANLQSQDITDFIYDEEQTMTAEEIVDKALSEPRRFIELPAADPNTESR